MRNQDLNKSRDIAFVFVLDVLLLLWLMLLGDSDKKATASDYDTWDDYVNSDDYSAGGAAGWWFAHHQKNK